MAKEEESNVPTKMSEAVQLKPWDEAKKARIQACMISASCELFTFSQKISLGIVFKGSSSFPCFNECK